MSTFIYIVPSLYDIKRLQENTIYAFKVPGYRRRIFGTPEAITVQATHSGRGVMPLRHMGGTANTVAGIPVITTR